MVILDFCAVGIPVAVFEEMWFSNPVVDISVSVYLFVCRLFFGGAVFLSIRVAGADPSLCSIVVSSLPLVSPVFPCSYSCPSP